MSITAMKQAMEALWVIAGTKQADEAITTLRTAIEAAERQEPVAWAEGDENGDIVWSMEDCFSDDPEWLDNPIPLYTTPPAARPAPVQDFEGLAAELFAVAQQSPTDNGFSDTLDRIENWLRERFTAPPAAPVQGPEAYTTGHWSATDIKTLRAIADEYNAWIRHYAAGHSYDDFLATKLATKLREKNGWQE